MQSRRKRTPFSVQNIEIIPVVELGNRWVYFGSTGEITPNLNPIDYQALERKQASITELLFAACDELAQQKNITPEEARGYFFTRYDENGTEIAPLSFTDYLTVDQKSRLVSLQAELYESKQLEIKTATLFIKHRIAYELTITEPAKLKAKSISVVEPWYDFNRGDKFRFGSQIVVVTSPYDPESGTIDVEPLSSPLDIGDAGFLLNPNKTYVLGDPTWSEEDTRNFIGTGINSGEEKALQKIYKFYLKETGKLDVTASEDEEETEDMGKALLPSESNELILEDSSTQRLQIGDNSTGESKATGLKIKDSALKTSVIAPVG